MHKKRFAFSGLTLVIFLCIAGNAHGDWNYRNGVGTTGSFGELRLNFFAQPRYEFVNDDGTGQKVSSFLLNLAGGRLRFYSPQSKALIQFMGGLAVDEAIVLDSFIELRPSEFTRIRFGHFRVPFDEQTTHYPFWMRSSSLSLDVREMSHGYNLGLFVQRKFLRNSLVMALSITNGESPSFTNNNIDFLYSGRMALRLGELFYWGDVDLIIGLGSSWMLEPWGPEDGLNVNRSVFHETFDLTFQLQSMTLSVAALYRLIDPGSYGNLDHRVGWHFDGAVFLGRIFEFGVRFAHLIPTLDEQDRHQFEAGVTSNVFVDQGHLRFLLEYTYVFTMNHGSKEFDAHRAVVQLQALY